MTILSRDIVYGSVLWKQVDLNGAKLLNVKSSSMMKELASDSEGWKPVMKYQFHCLTDSVCIFWIGHSWANTSIYPPVKNYDNI